MSKNKNKKEKQHKLNNEITAPQIRLTGEGYKGEVVTLKEALTLANEQELDLVLLNENNGIAVCKIMNYEKFIYELSKKPKQKTLDVKEIKLGPNTSENDLSYRTKHIIEFLDKGHRIKLSMRFKGREMMFVDKGMELMLNLILSVEKHGVSENLPKLEGKQIIGYIKPITKK
jgi:translation initiation factor IF-3